MVIHKQPEAANMQNTVSVNTVAVRLTDTEIGVLRAVLYEYYSENEYFCEIEAAAHASIESKLAAAEDSVC
jgi:hypothetical protein